MGVTVLHYNLRNKIYLFFFIFSLKFFLNISGTGGYKSRGEMDRCAEMSKIEKNDVK